MTTTEARKVAGPLFKCHPSIDAFFVSSDGQAFFNETSANNHAQSLQEKDVIKVEREDVLDDKEDSAQDAPAKVKPYSQWKKDDLLLELANRAIEAPEGATNKVLADLLTESDAAK
jgi:hypothetical protein